MDRIININKPKGMTSHDVVYKVRRILNTKKVGHTGTLDPDACGVLPICIGRATKLSSLLLEKDKVYVCKMKVGIETDTYDASGKIMYTSDTSGITEEMIIEALMSQVGKIDQLPPIYSALKVNGKKMYELARENRADEIVLVPRPIEIYSIDILSVDMENLEVEFRVHSSKGTYIRSICHDVGKLLGVGAHMVDLNREKSGIFTIDRSISLEELESASKSMDEDEYSYSIEEVLSDYPKIVLRDNAVKYYSNGGIIEERRFEYKDYKADDELVRVYSKEGFIGVGKLKRDEGVTVKSHKIFV